MAVRIHQIFYDDRQQPFLDPAFIPYDNRANPNPEWREYHVFRSAWLAGQCRDGDVTGFLSWKFSEKTGLRGKRFIRFIRWNPGYDVYFAHPFRVDPQPCTNIWQQAERHHPGILALTQRIVDAIGLNVDLASFQQPREQVLFCNYWAGTRPFWDAYMGFCEPVYRHIREGLDDADRRLIWSRADREIDAPYVPFIMERLFSTFLGLTPSIRSLGLDVARATRRPWYRRMFRRLRGPRPGERTGEAPQGGDGIR
jgi:hypothetical protein